jgi:inosose dehydratase
VRREDGHLCLGIAPDSWGVWFPEDPRQVPWTQFLDEASRAGYGWIELGPFGYLPTDAEQLQDELGVRNLRLAGGTMSAGLHRGREAFEEALHEARRVAALVAALGACHLVLLPEMYRDLDGKQVYAAELSRDEWENLVTGASSLSRAVAEEYGVRVEFHPHADSHVDNQERVERFLDDTAGEGVSLCLDTGHVAYCGGSSAQIVERYPERIGYVHLKAVDPAVAEVVRREGIGFAEAVRRGVMVELPNGEPAIEPLLEKLERLGVDIFTIVEQDMFPCDPDVPLPIATRTREYLMSCRVSWKKC